MLCPVPPEGAETSSGEPCWSCSSRPHTCMWACSAEMGGGGNIDMYHVDYN